MKTVFTFSLVFTLSMAHACTCIPIRSFCELVTRSLDWDSSHLLVARAVLVEKVRVDDYRTDAIFQVLESFHNPIGVAQVRIRDGNGADCGRTMNPYNVGDELIFATTLWCDSSALGQFSICSPPPLRVNGDRVSGEIFKDKSVTISLRKFRELECLPRPSLYMKFFPNPARQVLYISDIQWSEEGPPVQVNIFNATGQLLLKRAASVEELTGGQVQIEVANMPEGTYFLSLTSGQYRNTEPFLVLH